MANGCAAVSKTHRPNAAIQNLGPWGRGPYLRRAALADHVSIAFRKSKELKSSASRNLEDCPVRRRLPKAEKLQPVVQGQGAGASATWEELRSGAMLGAARATTAAFGKIPMIQRGI